MNLSGRDSFTAHSDVNFLLQEAPKPLRVIAEPPLSFLRILLHLSVLLFLIGCRCLLSEVAVGIHCCHRRAFSFSLSLAQMASYSLPCNLLFLPISRFASASRTIASASSVLLLSVFLQARSPLTPASDAAVRLCLERLYSWRGEEAMDDAVRGGRRWLVGVDDNTV